MTTTTSSSSAPALTTPRNTAMPTETTPLFFLNSAASTPTIRPGDHVQIDATGAVEDGGVYLVDREGGGRGLSRLEAAGCGLWSLVPLEPDVTPQSCPETLQAVLGMIVGRAAMVWKPLI